MIIQSYPAQNLAFTLPLSRLISYEIKTVPEAAGDLTGASRTRAEENESVVQRRRALAPAPPRFSENLAQPTDVLWLEQVLVMARYFVDLNPGTSPPPSRIVSRRHRRPD